jgi:hypothetical protein
MTRHTPETTPDGTGTDTTTGTGTPAKTGRDAWVVAGLTIVAVTAVVASFSTLAGLARVTGWGERASWLLPCCIDALAMAAGRVWLSGRAPEAARRYARTVALAAVAVSVVGNAIGHLVGAGYLQPTGTAGTALVILVGSVPAGALAAVGHLATLAAHPVNSHDRDHAARIPVPVPEPKTGTGTGTTTGTRTDTGTQVETTAVSRPTGKQDSRRPGASARTATSSGGTKRDKARGHWDTERAEGRTPSGADLARVAGADPTMGRRWRRDWLTETTPAQLTETATVTEAGESDRITEGQAA